MSDAVKIVKALSEPIVGATYEESTYAFLLTSEEGFTARFVLTKAAVRQFTNSMAGSAFQLMAIFPEKGHEGHDHE